MEIKQRILNTMIEVTTRADRTEFYNSGEWRELRKLALERDHNECVWCQGEGKVTRENLEVDHIKELEFYPKFAKCSAKKTQLHHN